MSNIIPPLLSNTPPPIIGPAEDDDDDEFGDFRVHELSYSCDNLSLPSSPTDSPKNQLSFQVPNNVDINSNQNKNNKIENEDFFSTEKDFQDRRKSIEEENIEIKNVTKDNFDKCIKDIINTDLIKEEIIVNNVNSFKEENIKSNIDIFNSENRVDSPSLKSDEKCESITEEEKEIQLIAENIENMQIKREYDFGEFKHHIGVEDGNKHSSEDLDFGSFLNSDAKIIKDGTSDPALSETENFESIDSSSEKDKNSDDDTFGEFSKNDESKKDLDLDDFGNFKVHLDQEENIQNEIIENYDFQETNSESEKYKTPEHLNKSVIFSDVESYKENENADRSENNDFCDFESHNNDKITKKEPEIKELPTIKTEMNAKTESFDTDDEFGNFETHRNNENQIPQLSSEIFSIERKVKTQNIDADDDVGNFETHENGKTQILTNLKFETHEDFGNFETHETKMPSTDILKTESSDATQPNLTAKDDDTNDEFGSFETHQNNETQIHHVTTDILKNERKVTNGEDFADFKASFQSDTPNNDDDDDFGDFSSISEDFGNFATFEPSPITLNLNKDQIFEKAQNILKEMFPIIEEITEDYLYMDISQDYLFTELKDVTETNAVKYHWSKSSSQNVLLKSLNIDARNILYGVSWNPSIPRFAATLGPTPLEPLKPSILTPTPVQKQERIPSNSSQIPTNSDIPTAQFDWGGSGLINPLDYSQTMLLDLEQLVATLDIPSCDPTNSNNSSSPNVELEDWDFWLQSVSTDTQHLEENIVSATEKQLEISPDTKNESLEDFGQFSSYQSPEKDSHGSQNWSKNIVPVQLRETHISNDVEELSNTEANPIDFGWLQPTVLTPQPVRKELLHMEDDFDNFQMASNKSTTYDDIKRDTEEDFDDFQQSEVHESIVNKELPVALNAEKEENENKHGLSNAGEIDDDEFTEFHSAAEPVVHAIPNEQPIGFTLQPIAQPGCSSLQPIVPSALAKQSSVQPILKPVPTLLQPVPAEPLQPSILRPSSVFQPPAKIEWPEPGVGEDEIKRFEAFGISRQKTNETKIDESKTGAKVSLSSIQSSPVKKGQLPKPPPIKSVNKVNSKQSSLDDDEWSDFVSVKQKSPLHRVQNTPERTASPDLPLSVLNLGNFQPTKPPIPIITPQGLMQTKLSADVPTNSSVLQQNKQHQPNYYLNQFINPKMSNGNHKNQFLQQTNSQKSLEDDDWSEFVSNPLPSAQKSPQHQGLHFSSGSTNIITNPGHFQTFQSNGTTLNKSTSKPKVQSSKCSVPSISSMPDLDFVAPKGWTMNRK